MRGMAHEVASLIDTHVWITCQICVTFTFFCILDRHIFIFCARDMSDVWMPCRRWEAWSAESVDKITSLFCRILSLLKGSFAKETYNRHNASCRRCWSIPVCEEQHVKPFVLMKSSISQVLCHHTYTFVVVIYICMFIYIIIVRLHTYVCCNHMHMCMYIYA